MVIFLIVVELDATSKHKKKGTNQKNGFLTFITNKFDIFSKTIIFFEVLKITSLIILSLDDPIENFDKAWGALPWATLLHVYTIWVVHTRATLPYF